MVQLDEAALAHAAARPEVQVVLLTCIALLALILRLYKLGEWSFWIDELYTLGRIEAHYGSSDAALKTILSSRWIPLSSLLSSFVLGQLGRQEWAARLTPALLGAVSIPILYLPVRRIFGSGVALLAALLLAISPWHIYWSQNARFYTSLMLLGSLALLALYFGLERDRRWYLLCFMILFYLAISERLSTLLLAPAAAVYILAVKWGRLKQPPGLRRGNVLLLVLPALAFVAVYAGAWNDLLTTFGGTANHGPLRLTAAIVYQLSVNIVGLAMAGGIYHVLQGSRAALFFLLAAVIPPVLLVAVSPFFFTVDRYIFAVLPFWLVLAALTIKELIARNTGLARVLGIGLLVAVVGTQMGEVALYFSSQSGNRPDWRRAYLEVAQRRSEADLIASAWPEVGQYYLNTDVLWINSFDASSPPHRRTWFLVDEAIGGVETSTLDWIRAESELVEVITTRLPGKSLDIRIFLYVP